MGNYYLGLNDPKQYEDHLKLSYKYFHPVLMEHIRNIYAANGLGVVCAKKGEFEAARQIFSKVTYTLILYEL